MNSQRRRKDFRKLMLNFDLLDSFINSFPEPIFLQRKYGQQAYTLTDYKRKIFPRLVTWCQSHNKITIEQKRNILMMMESPDKENWLIGLICIQQVCKS